jgi:peptidoglycan-associated lipoprotein
MTGESTMKAARSLALLAVSAALVTAVACGKKTPPLARPMPPPPPPTVTSPPSRPPVPPEPAREPVSVPSEPVRDDAISSASLDDLNKNSPLKPVYFELDSSDLNAVNQRTLDENAALLKRYPSWAVTIEGHCDERGTAEYNLALGERRALSARTYLVSLGIAADRLRTVSYGKEFPFDPGHDEAAFVKNRRAHFVITAK